MIITALSDLHIPLRGLVINIPLRSYEAQTDQRTILRTPQTAAVVPFYPVSFFRLKKGGVKKLIGSLHKNKLIYHDASKCKRLSFIAFLPRPVH